ncbi:Dna2/Cas4 domain-containing protein [Thermococcus stetteri]|uniref:Dna2/Cas4 domain-containing protein n=1 Tax=Thermococcus stetteri TaxID=49900 RepID=UPI003743BF34|nr:CRISPR/Cas system-associated exonuclease Cas4 (RecB family) [Thermococcus stetteri]
MEERTGITGVMVQYYFACKRELWFFSRGLNFDFDFFFFNKPRPSVRGTVLGKLTLNEESNLFLKPKNHTITLE